MGIERIKELEKQTLMPILGTPKDENGKFDGIVKSPIYPLNVIPAKAGIQLFQTLMDSRFRGSDTLFDFQVT